MIFANWNKTYSSEYKWGEPTLYKVVIARGDTATLAWKAPLKTKVFAQTFMHKNNLWVISDSIAKVDGLSGQVELKYPTGAAYRNIINADGILFVETTDNRLVAYALD